MESHRTLRAHFNSLILALDTLPNYCYILYTLTGMILFISWVIQNSDKLELSMCKIRSYSILKQNRASIQYDVKTHPQHSY